MAENASRKKETKEICRELLDHDFLHELFRLANYYYERGYLDEAQEIFHSISHFRQKSKKSSC